MAEVIPAPAPAERVAQYVVTSENRAEFMDKRLDISKPPAKEPAVVVEIPKFGETPEPKKEEEPAPKKGHAIQERFSEMAEKRREAEAREKAAIERAERAEREAQELKTRTVAAPEPKEEEQIGPKPDRAKFENEAEYTEKLVEWSIRKDRIERDAAAEKARIEAEQKQILTSWQERLDKTRGEIADYDEKIEGAKNVAFSNQVRDAIFESPVGPRILYYFAEHPEEAEKLKSLSALSAVRAIGRLEADLTPKEKEVKSSPKAAEAQVSRAPAPISPLKGSSAPEELVDSAGKFSGSYKQFKQLRKEGKLK